MTKKRSRCHYRTTTTATEAINGHTLSVLPILIPRFNGRAYTLDEAVEDYMFRCLDIVDPENQQDGVILQLEQEMRSDVNKDESSQVSSCLGDKRAVDERSVE
jgi:hypothetical protein